MAGALPLQDLRFRGQWRRYQRLALDAFERDRAAGRRRTHLVAPPGSGKTLLGVELIRRLGAAATVLVPNSAIQAQWPRAVAQFLSRPDEAPHLAAADPGAPIACLTYQSLCRLEDPGEALLEAAEARWAADRARATGAAVEEVRREVATWSGEAARRRRRELSRVVAAIKREVARGERTGVELGELLSEGARRRIAQLAARGDRQVIVLDECHHLASLWGYVVGAVVEQLGHVHVIGLTATPPADLTTDESEMYEHLLGPVDFTVPAPAVVRDGHLAPFQELAWLTEPLDGERRWLAEHDVRFQELITRLHDDAEGPLSFPGWVITRLRHRRSADDEGEVAWESFQRRSPALARAGVRFLTSAGLALPPGAPTGEGYRQRPGLDDWIVLLEDYALRCLGSHPSPQAAVRYEEVGAALRDLGFQLTRRGIRRGASDVDRLLTMSAAKAIGLVEVVACEHDARGEALRALVLVDAEARRPAEGELAAVMAPGAGTAVEAVHALAGDLRTAPLAPLLVSGRGLRCAPGDGQRLLDALREAADDRLGLDDWKAEEDADRLVRLSASGSRWQAGVWVGLATMAFARGATQALIGTRALLGEGWDAPWVNCLVDLTAATTSVSVAQMRGRSLRLDPAVPDKISSNWDVVCVAPELARGSADYERFVRKHLHLFAPCEDGAIEAGPSHVHPDLGPFSPPASERFPEVNRAMIDRAARHAEARERWRIGTPYSGVELRTVLVRPRAPSAAPAGEVERPPDYPVDQRWLLGATAATGWRSPPRGQP